MEEEQAKSSPVGRLSSFRAAFATAPPRIARAVARGYFTELKKPHSPPPRRAHYIRDPAELTFANNEMERLIAKGALIPDPKATSLPYFVVRGSAKWRLVYDARWLNERILAPTSVQYEDLRGLHALLLPGDMMWKVDLKSAFHHLKLADSLSKELGISYRGTTYRWTVLPFGLSTAPAVWQAIMQHATRDLSLHGIRSRVYLDDVLFLAQPGPDLWSKIRLSVETLLSSGFVLNLQKSILVPSTRIEFLGLEIDSERRLLSVPKRKRKELLGFAQSLASSDGSIRLRTLARIQGKIISLGRAFAVAKRFIWNLVRQLRSSLDDPSVRGSWNQRVVLSTRTKQDLLLLVRMGRRAHWSAPILPPASRPAIELQTDASTSIGWGAFLPETSSPAHGTWTPEESSENIMVLEMRAVLRAIAAFDLRSCSLRIVTDSRAVEAYIRNWGGSVSTQLLSETHKLFEACSRRKIFIADVRWIPTTQNTVADRLSRLQCSATSLLTHVRSICAHGMTFFPTVESSDSIRTPTCPDSPTSPSSHNPRNALPMASFPSSDSSGDATLIAASPYPEPLPPDSPKDWLAKRILPTISSIVSGTASTLSGWLRSFSTRPSHPNTPSSSARFAPSPCSSVSERVKPADFASSMWSGRPPDQRLSPFVAPKQTTPDGGRRSSHAVARNRPIENSSPSPTTRSTCTSTAAPLSYPTARHHFSPTLGNKALACLPSSSPAFNDKSLIQSTSNMPSKCPRTVTVKAAWLSTNSQDTKTLL